MAGIGDTLRAERRRQGRSLADAAAETRVRESYLAAIEDEDFRILGGDVYARGFIKLYGQYLSLDAEALVQQFRSEHASAPEATPAFPSGSIDDILPPPRSSRQRLSPPILAALAIVALMVVVFAMSRSGGDATVSETEDPNAPGPSPAEVADQPTGLPTDDPAAALGDMPANPLVDGAAAPTVDGPALTEVVVDVSVLAPVRLSVLQGQPPVSNALLAVGDTRRLTGPEGVVLQVSDAAAVTVSVNGLPLVGLGGSGQSVQVSCLVGRPGCDVAVL